MKRYLIFLLLLTFVLLSCTQTAEPDKRTAIFSGTELPLDVQTVADPPALSWNGDALTVRALQPGDTAVTLTFGTDGSLTGSAPVPDVPPDVIPAGGMLLDRHTVDGGEIVYAASYDTEPVSCAALLRGGQTVLTFDPAGDLGYSLKYDNPRAGELFRLTDALAVSVGEETRYLLLSEEGLCCYRADGTLLWAERGNLTRDIACVGGEVCVLRQKAEEQTLHFLNTDDGSRSEAVSSAGRRCPSLPSAKTTCCFPAAVTICTPRAEPVYLRWIFRRIGCLPTARRSSILPARTFIRTRCARLS